VFYVYIYIWREVERNKSFRNELLSHRGIIMTLYVRPTLKMQELQTVPGPRPLRAKMSLFIVRNINNGSMKCNRVRLFLHESFKLTSLVVI